ncbi:DUF2852 domain-containing protein [Rhodosalinus sp. FB01]|uniref:DUF2852 domain-containing protein n=1 Tax=Rhodosalinus sp. FB01 TaxID=3239194 RepID=UPI0035239ECF
MTSAATDWTRARPGHWFSRAEAWLDSQGKGAWIAAMVLGFILFWPLGLALLAYMIWSKRLFGSSCRNENGARAGLDAMTPSGNSAFDAYKADTLRRLEEEQKSFHEFLQRLREARDKAEFDQFMEERARAARTAPDDTDGAGPRDL